MMQKELPLAGASVVLYNLPTRTATDGEGNLKSVACTQVASIGTVVPQGLNRKLLRLNDINGDLTVKWKKISARLDDSVCKPGFGKLLLKRRNLANSVATISNKQLNGIAPAQTFDASI
jgi:hypothetical protein